MQSVKSDVSVCKIVMLKLLYLILILYKIDIILMYWHVKSWVMTAEWQVGVAYKHQVGMQTEIKW